MKGLTEVEQLVKSHLPPLRPEKVTLPNALGRVIAEDLFAPEDVPPYPRSAMDGYAVKAEDVAFASRTSPAILTVVDCVHAGDVPLRPLGEGEAVAVATGAPLPEGADAVVRVEDTKPVNPDDSPFVPVGGKVAILTSVPKGKNVSPVGEDVRKGELVACKGQKVTPALIGLLASCGFWHVPVFAYPKAAVNPTGSELVPVTEKPSVGQIRNSTAWAIAAALKECGVEPFTFEPVPDDVEKLAQLFREVASDFDLVLTCGGVSFGQCDLVKEAWKRLGAKVLFANLPLRPGKAALAVVWQGKLAVGLSGNPAAALTTFDLILRPAICDWTGNRQNKLIPLTAELSTPVAQANGFLKAVRVKLEQRDGKWLAHPLKGQLSTVLSSLAQADGYALILPGNGETKAGETVTVLARSSILASDSMKLDGENLQARR